VLTAIWRKTLNIAVLPSDSCLQTPLAHICNSKFKPCPSASGRSETGRSLLAVDTNVLMQRDGRAALTAWLAHSDGVSALLIPHVRLQHLVCCRHV
jgi:hypothetical protein